MIKFISNLRIYLNSSTDVIPLKNSLKNLSYLAILKQMVCCKIQSIPNFQSLKGDVELILYACNTLENYQIDIGANKIDKKILVVNAFTELFSLTEDEKLTLNNTIQFLFDHNKIKQIKKVIVLGNKIKNWIIKKFA